MPSSADVLVVMAKYPTPGAIKTRLARDVGDAAAAALYRAFLADIAARLAAGPWRLVWAVAPAGADLAAWVGPGQRQIDHVGEGLGRRMCHCFEQLFGEGAARVAMIGADMPHLGVAQIGAAFTGLERHDAVLVPTRDGGYGLIALRGAVDVFTMIPMGTSEVFARTCDRLDTLGLGWSALATSFDVDDLEDVAELRRQLAMGVVQLPHTSAVLESSLFRS